VLAVLAVGWGAAAATDTFTVETAVLANDLTPPTTPTDLSAIPVAATQIDLSWTASTDDVAVAGYVVRRDGVAIATTTLTTLNDTGLLAETLYSYTVQAFDAASRYSSTSAAVATTTLAAPPPTPTSTPATTGGEEATRLTLAIRGVEIDTTTDTATVTFITNLPAQLQLRWGETIDYESGSLQSAVFRREHQSVVTALRPGTTYRVLIVAEGRDGSVVRVEQQFTTAGGSDRVAPVNVHNFQAVREEPGVRLRWQNPPDDDWARVRIMASDRFYPTSPDAGWFVYDGAGTSAYDDRPFTEGVRYYTAFAYDQAGNRSSGAVTFVAAAGALVPGQPSEPLPGDTAGRDLDLAVFQDGQLRPFGDDGFITLAADQPTRLRVPYQAVPEHLKAVVATIAPAADETQQFSFLLRITPEQDAYEAVIGALEVTGRYTLTLSLYDYDTRQIVTREIPLMVVGALPAYAFGLYGYRADLSWFAIALLLLPLAWLLLRWLQWFVGRRRESR
jgi:chitodextrinase